MSQDVFTRALELAMQDEGSPFTIGGGEPTLHPKCLDFVWQAIRASLRSSYDAGTSIVGIVTNGSIEKRALELAHMAKMGLISARLSYDKFHELEKVSDRVRDAFKRERGDWGEVRNDRDLRMTNQMSYFVTPHGRALDNGIYDHPYSKVGSCCCEGAFVTPDGTIWQCGCRKKKVGHVNDLNAFWQVREELRRETEDYEMPCSQAKTA